jgi:hypothetical protein
VAVFVEDLRESSWFPENQVKILSLAQKHAFRKSMNKIVIKVIVIKSSLFLF